MKFIANNRMKQALNEEIMALFPAEQARVAELLAEGILHNLYVAADYSRAWLILEGNSEEAARQALQSLPLYPYSDSELIPLAQEG